MRRRRILGRSRRLEEDQASFRAVERRRKPAVGRLSWCQMKTALRCRRREQPESRRRRRASDINEVVRLVNDGRQRLGWTNLRARWRSTRRTSAAVTTGRTAAGVWRAAYALVTGAVEVRGDKMGRARLEVLPAATAEQFQWFAMRNIEPHSVAVTDGLAAYGGLPDVGIGHQQNVIGKDSRRRAIKVLPRVHKLFSPTSTSSSSASTAATPEAAGSSSTRPVGGAGLSRPPTRSAHTTPGGFLSQPDTPTVLD